MEKRVLGRGLSALIPDKTDLSKSDILEDKSKKVMINIPLDKIKVNKYQPREEFDRALLEELAVSIKEKGFLQPVIVRVKDDFYELIAGERRLRAAGMLKLQEVPAIIKDASDQDSLELSIIENIQRESLNPIDQAKAYKRLLDEFDMTQEKIADTIGKDRVTVANILRLLKLPNKIKEYVSRGTLTMGHARAILGLDKEEDQMRICTKVIKNNLSVRDTERYVKKIDDTGILKKKKTVDADPNLIAIQDELRDILGTKININKSKKGGRIEIEFYSDEDLERIITLLKSNS